MALNVPLTTGPDGPFPLPFPGEVFVLTRDKISITVKDAEMELRSLRGRLFVTSMRQVFLPSDPAKARGVASVELPWRGLWDERFNQPIFGVNNLTATVQYYDGEPFNGTLSVRLDFKEGGCNTYLPVFNNILRATRAQLELEARGSEPGPIPAAGVAASEPSEYYPGHNDAFVDPRDTSRLYTTQPVVSEAPREEMPRWNPSAANLRRRRD
jgi:hypothetical protein